MRLSSNTMYVLWEEIQMIRWIHCLRKAISGGIIADIRKNLLCTVIIVIAAFGGKRWLAICSCKIIISFFNMQALTYALK